MTSHQFSIKMLSCHYRDSHYKDMTAMRPSYLKMGIPILIKIPLLYWITPLAPCVASRDRNDCRISLSSFLWEKDFNDLCPLSFVNWQQNKHVNKFWLFSQNQLRMKKGWYWGGSVACVPHTDTGSQSQLTPLKTINHSIPGHHYVDVVYLINNRSTVKRCVWKCLLLLQRQICLLQNYSG